MADPLAKLDQINNRVSKGFDNLIEPIRDFGERIDNHVVKVQDAGEKVAKTAIKISFPGHIVANPIGGIILAKNLRNNPDKSTDEILDMTVKEELDWFLTGANIAWPGTAAPNAKSEVKDKVGGLVEEITGFDVVGQSERFTR